MKQQQGSTNFPKSVDIGIPKSLKFSIQPILNKVQSFENTLYSGFSNGMILQYKYNQNEKTYQYVNKFHPYQNTDVIDIDQYDTDVLLTCSHNQVTLFNLTKNKSISLKGHESTPIAVSVHPVSPYVISVSNAVIEHDVRIAKPINVNFITLPAYDIQFFPDGKQFILSGQPCRIGRSKWIRSLLSGIAKPSLNSKYVASNDMNGKISLWDWRESQQVAIIEDVKNMDSYQPIHFGMNNGNIKDIFFFQDNGVIMKYDILARKKTQNKLFDIGKGQNWKMITRNVDYTTKSVIIYEHFKASMKLYDLRLVTLSQHSYYIYKNQKYMIKIITSTSLTLLNRRLTNYFALLRFPLPDLGQKIKEGRVRKLYVKEGDKIQQFEKLADVESDKQFTEITAPEVGFIKKIYYKQDEVCRVGDIFLQIETNGQNETNQTTSKADLRPVHPVMEPIVQPATQIDDVLASATVKMLARQHKITLDQLTGTGRKGRILKQDILNYVQDRNNKKNIKSQVSMSPASTIQPTPTTFKTTKIEVKDNPIIVTLNNNQRQMINLVNYSTTIPHLYFQQTVDVTDITTMIDRLAQKKIKISLLSVLIKTFSLAITHHPRINSTYNLEDPFNFKTHPSQYLILPFYSHSGFNLTHIPQLESLSINKIEQELQFLQQQVASGKYEANNNKGTVCLSNIGSVGGISVNPLIYGQMSCHASIGSLREIPISKDGKFLKRKVVDINLGCDHRVLDGASVGRFAMHWKELSENPTFAFLEMI